MNGLLREISFNGIAPSVIDEKSETLTYIGYARVPSDIEEAHKESKPIWAIKRIEKTGNVTKIKWANGSQSFTNKWSERDNYTYKY